MGESKATLKSNEHNVTAVAKRIDKAMGAWCRGKNNPQEDGMRCRTNGSDRLHTYAGSDEGLLRIKNVLDRQRYTSY